MELGIVEIFLLIAVFAPLLTGLALIDLLDRAGAPIDVTSTASAWVVVIVCVPLVGPYLYFTSGREQIDAELVEHLAPTVTGPHPVLV